MKNQTDEPQALERKDSHLHEHHHKGDFWSRSNFLMELVKQFISSAELFGSLFDMIPLELPNNTNLYLMSSWALGVALLPALAISLSSAASHYMINVNHQDGCAHSHGPSLSEEEKNVQLTRTDKAIASADYFAHICELAGFLVLTINAINMAVATANGKELMSDWVKGMLYGVSIVVSVVANYTSYRTCTENIKKYRFFKNSEKPKEPTTHSTHAWLDCFKLCHS